MSTYTETPAIREQRRKAYVFTLVLSSLNQYGSINGLKNWINDMIQYFPSEDIGLLSYAQTSNNTLWLMVDAMDSVLTEEVKHALGEAEFLAFTVDSSTDNSTTDYMDVEVRFWKGGKVLYLFLALVKMGANIKAFDQATMILSAIKDFTGLSADQLKQKVISIGADGCSTMQGKHNGVLVNLKREAFPYMLPTSCAAHKANLACEVIDNVPSFKYLCSLVKDTRNYFSNSPKRTTKLECFYKETGLKFKKMERIMEVRWMPVCDAFHSFCRGLPAILNYLYEEQQRDPEAKVLFGKLTDFTTLWEIFLYLPLLDNLMKMMKDLQLQNLFYKDLNKILQKTVDRVTNDYLNDERAFKGLFKLTFEGLFARQGRLHDVYDETPFFWQRDQNGERRCYFKGRGRNYLLHFTRYDKEELQNLDLDKHRKRALSMMDLLNDDTEDLSKSLLPPEDWVRANTDHERFLRAMESTAKVISSTASAFLSALQNRFPPSNIIQAFDILSPETFLDGNVEENVLEKIKVLEEQFCCIACDKRNDCLCNPPIDRVRLYSQTQDFIDIGVDKSLKFSKRDENEQGSGPVVFFNFLLERGLMQSKCPEYVKLMKLILTVPLTTVENERRFAHMNLTKTDRRSRLNEDHLNACLRLKHVPDQLWIDKKAVYNNLIIPSYQKWNEDIERRL